MSTANKRLPIPPRMRSEVLMANRHLCCVCQAGYLQIHHIDGNPSNNSTDNLAVLCMVHHDMATAPRGMTARLTQQEIQEYKTEHELACTVHAHKVARGRTAFFMVDYKNCERILQIYQGLGRGEYERAFEALTEELQEEAVLREEQGYNCSLEPNTKWSPTVKYFLDGVKRGGVPVSHEEAVLHPKDPTLPMWMPYKGIHDIWVQIMVRAILVNRPALPLEDIMQLDAKNSTALAGRLVTVSGRLRGRVRHPDEYVEHPVSQTGLFVLGDGQLWRSKLSLKTHYVYSDTAKSSLSDGRTQGLVVFRDMRAVRHRNNRRVVTFDCTPLILGCGGGGELRIPKSVDPFTGLVMSEIRTRKKLIEVAVAVGCD